LPRHLHGLTTVASFTANFPAMRLQEITQAFSNHFVIICHENAHVRHRITGRETLNFMIFPGKLQGKRTFIAAHPKLEYNSWHFSCNYSEYCMDFREW
jgi:hypothetical protein